MARIALGDGLFTEVDDDDLQLVSAKRWRVHIRRDGKAYYVISTDGVRMHRFIMGVDDARIVDHRDGDGLNNRRCNLRVGTQSQNCVNRRTTPGPLLRGVKRNENRFQAQITYRKKTRYLGSFKTELEAHQAYVAAARDLHGDWLQSTLAKAAQEDSAEGKPTA